MRLITPLLLLILVTGCVIGLLPGHSDAAAGEIYLSPSSASVQVGNQITLGLRINPGVSVNAVQATINYDASDLQFVSLSLSAFPTCVQDSGGGGSVVFSCTILGSSVTSDSLIANVNFEALTGSGSTSLTLSNANAANNGSYTDPSTAGATISFTTPAPPPSSPSPPPSSGNSSHSSKTTAKSSSSPTTPSTSSSSSSSTPTSSSSASSPTSSTPTTSTSPVKISSTPTQIEFNKASIVVSSNTPAQFYIKYGTSKNDLNLSTTPTMLGKTATVSLANANLTPGTKYYYEIIAKSADGGIQAQTPLSSLTTKGYTLSVTVLDNQYHPLVGKLVTLHSAKPLTATTNSRGIATFTNVAPGLHHVDYSNDSHIYSQTLYVTNDFVTHGYSQTAAPQTAAVVLSSYHQPSGISASEILGLLVVLIIGGFILISPRRPRPIKYPHSEPAVVEKMATIFQKQIELHHR